MSCSSAPQRAHRGRGPPLCDHFFVLLLVVEALSFHSHEDDLVGYELRDTRTSITMGLGNVAVNAVWKLVVVASTRHGANERYLDATTAGS